MQKFEQGDMVKKKSGSEWQGKIVGWYSTTLTPEGYAVESESHKGSVQIYPASALELDGEIAMSANVKVITDGWKQDDCQYKVVFNYGNGLKVFEQECLTLEIAKGALDALVGYTDSLREAGLITKDTYFGQVLVKDGEKWNGLDIKIKLTV